MATIVKYISEQNNINDTSLYSFKRVKYTSEQNNINDASLYGYIRKKYYTEKEEIFQHILNYTTKGIINTEKINENTYFYNRPHKYTTDNEEIQDNIKLIFTHYLIYDKITKQCPAISPVNTFVTQLPTLIGQPQLKPKTKKQPITITGFNAFVKSYDYKNKKYTARLNSYLELNNTLKINYLNFTFNLGVISSEKIIPVTLASTYNTDITITRVTNDFNLGIDTDLYEGNIIPANGNLSFNFRINVDIGKTTVNNNHLYFILDNGVIIDFRFCFIRNDKNVPFLSPDKYTYEENYSFFSKTFVSLAGREDVIPFMDTPKKSFSANYSYRSYEVLEAMRNTVFKTETDTNYFPIWSELTYTSEAAFNQSYSIKVVRLPYFLKPEDHILLQKANNEASFKVLTVKDIDEASNTITIYEPTTYTQGSVVIPLAKVVISSNSTTEYYNTKDQKLSISVRTLE